MANYEGHIAKRPRTDDGGRGEFNTFNNRGGGQRPQFEEKPNHILLITVLNPAYPITTDVIHTICSPSGKVLRIVIFKKNGVQAMVEFDGIEAAERAKQSLNGCDIYSGCCTLKIEFAKPTRLNVYKNDNESWDYTSPNINKSPGPEQRPALLQEPPRGYGPPEPRGGPPYDGGYNNGYAPRGPPRPDPYGPPGRDHYGGPPDRYGQEPYRNEPPLLGPRGPGYGPGPGGPYPGGNQQGCVMMAYGMNHEKMNADKLFNILCLYGNVNKIKFLKSKEGCAMIEMADPVAVERAISNLHNSTFFDSELQLSVSKQPCLNPVPNPYNLPDNSPSYKDFQANRNNRFSNPAAAAKNRIIGPSKLLHFYNAPFGVTQEEMVKVFEDRGAKPPVAVTPFSDSKNKSERSSSGLLEFSSESEALEGLALCNHVQIKNPNGQYPFILKLCFSSTGGGGHRGPPRGGGRGGRGGRGGMKRGR